MKKVLFSNFTIGIVLTLFTFGALFFQVGFFESLELKTYDLRSFLRQSTQPIDEIAVVTIDDDSIAKIGRWPWPRTLIAQGISTINQSGAKVIGLNILFTEPEKNQGLIEIKNLQETIPDIVDADVKYSKYIKTKNIEKKFFKKVSKKIKENISAELEEASVRLDNDSKLQQALAEAKNVILPMYFTIGPSLGNEELVLTSQTVTSVENPDDVIMYYITEGHSPVIPLDIFSEQSSGIGHSNLLPDIDGVVRAELPLIQFQGEYYPSLAVQIVKQYLNLPIDSISLRLGNYLKIGKATVPIDDMGRMLISYNGPVGTFPYYSFYDVINNKIDPDAIKNRIVLLGAMATGIAGLNVTPLGHNFPDIEITANIIQNILYQNFITRPQWAAKAELISLAVIGLFIALLLPRLKAFLGALLSFLIFFGIVGSSTYFFVTDGYWIKIFYQLFLLTSGYLIITSKRFLITERKKELVEASAIETNKMLGLSFQGQGMLDMAFEKLRKCPIDDQMKELLYNLALDFERKRQFNKAVAVYEHIMSADSKYKGIDERIKQLKAAADGAVFGGVGAKKSGGEGTVILEGAAATTPTLGRYEIVKELGKGAMGTVYLGKDPKINRQVAIKTLHFDDDVDEATMKSIKERFFREAESAGNLSHPNIIKIYDAGEDNEISYIAMELLEGDDLKKNAAKENLLPMRTAIDYVIKCAEALDYAHQQGIVHRDIKPGNIMLLNNGTIRIADFGIARITSSSKTATGTVLGTPSYMSPEQLSGKKVDGKSDLFSLGVVLYELLTGTKPFEGDSIATLMFKIANEKHPNPKDVNPDIPDCIVKVIDKILEKNPEQRYQRGQEIADDLKECLKAIPNEPNAAS
ncbi:MAG: CHASE2 domain-containing protein [Endomicrobiales bacterium]|nr:CHASE2 domain-containing protein [Endomicrobiales bacterium]